MTRRRLKPLVFPAALLVAGGLVAGLAEAAAGSPGTMMFYGMVKLVSDLVLAIGGTWLAISGVRIWLAVRR